VTDTGTTVSLLQFPVETFLQARAHNEALVREFVFIVSAGDAEDVEVPARLVELVEAIRTRFLTRNVDVEEQIERAHDEGVAAIDLMVYLVPEGRQAAGDLLELFAAADDYCRRCELLTLAATEEVRWFREWAFGECIRQIDGDAPRPWPAFQATIATTRS
jgi:hypothetical protein